MRFRLSLPLTCCLACLLSTTLLHAGDNYAFIVGIGGYDEKHLTPLGEYPRNDAVEFRDVLIQSGFKAQNIVLMTDDLKRQPESATAGRYLPESAKIKKELGLLLPSLERDDALIIALAGHGVQFKGDDEPYFCPLDANLSDKKTLISLLWLYDQLKYDQKTFTGCKPRQKLLLIDACRNDPASRIFRSSARGPGLASVTLPQVAPLPEGVVALFSCAEGQQALQHDPLKHGVFFYHVLEGWKGKADGDRDQKVTLDEVIAYTKSQTQTYARLKLAAPQTPRQKGYFDGIWELRSLADKSLLTSRIGMKLKLIPEGEFLMGSPKDEEGRSSDEGDKPHRVRITQPFYMGIHEVTVGQFRRFVTATSYRTEAETDGEGGYGWNESTGKLEGQDVKYNWKSTGFAQTDDHPVVNVTWNDAVKFCEWLSRTEGKTYRLPTEAEWEYACRAGSSSRFSFGDSEGELTRHANVADATAKAKLSNYSSLTYTSGRDGFVFTAPVGSFRANDFGLHDLHGNVWEWCQDLYDSKAYTNRGAVTSDPLVKTGSGSSRVLRGGSWFYYAIRARSAYRDYYSPGNRSYGIGFRVVAE